MGESLTLLLRLAIERREQAAQRLQQARQRCLQAQQKLQQLQSYQQEYASRLGALARVGMGGQQWNDFQRFLHKLEAARCQQHQEIKQSEQAAMVACQQWQVQEREVKAFETLQTRHLQRFQQQQQRYEQKSIDDWVMRQQHLSDNDLH